MQKSWKVMCNCNTDQHWHVYTELIIQIQLQSVQLCRTIGNHIGTTVENKIVPLSAYNTTTNYFSAILYPLRLQQCTINRILFTHIYSNSSNRGSICIFQKEMSCEKCLTNPVIHVHHFVSISFFIARNM